MASNSGSSTQPIPAPSNSIESVPPNAQPSSKPRPSDASAAEQKYQPSFSIHTIRQHIKHWLFTAKTVCNNSLTAIIFKITTYVEKEALNLRLSYLRSPPMGHTRLVVSFRRTHAQSGVCATQFLHQEVLQLEPNSDLMSLPINRPFWTTTPCCLPRQSFDRALLIPTDFQLSPAANPLHHQRSISVNPLDLSELSSVSGPTLLSRQGSRQEQGSHPSASILAGSEFAVHVAFAVAAAEADRPASGLSSYLVPSNEKFHNSSFVAASQEISSIATEILDTPAGLLAATSHAWSSTVFSSSGEAGTSMMIAPIVGGMSNPVRVLLAVAGLRRVLEWWDAEKGFWNFEPEDEENGEEICFFATRVEHSGAAGLAPNLGRANSSNDVIGKPHPLVDGETQGSTRFRQPPMSGMRRRRGGAKANNRESNLKKVLSLTQPAPPRDLSLVKADSVSSFSEDCCFREDVPMSATSEAINPASSCTSGSQYSPPLDPSLVAAQSNATADPTLIGLAFMFKFLISILVRQIVRLFETLMESAGGATAAEAAVCIELCAPFRKPAIPAPMIEPDPRRPYCYS
ncbi:hypothetical protein PCASD_20072 [Puccinia coronata f. sp. avenae]|nr:hypothetical protein PCASD_20072 [Puccinia coronata f. sp. avenae]